MRAAILFCDDDTDSLLSLTKVLSLSLQSKAAKFDNLHFELLAAPNISKAIELAEKHSPIAAVIDLHIEGPRGTVESGFDLVKKLSEIEPDCRSIVLTGHGSTANGVQAIKLGASSFLEKPADPDTLASLLIDASRFAILRNELKKSEKKRAVTLLESSLVGTSDKIQRLREELAYAARNSAPVLFQGETGTGKSLCAKIVHKLSPRSEKRLVTYQPTFANFDLCNSELFGHKKGAFTGATEDREGLISQAHGGTLFLDEVNSLPLESQVLLLRTLQEKTIKPVGSSKELIADFRLITATNENAKALVESGVMRRDFYHRIAHNVIRIPPLRERLEDIPELVLVSLEQLTRSSSDECSVVEATTGVLETLQSYSWPGNVRELSAVVEGAAYRARDCGRVYIDSGDLRIDGEKAKGLSPTGEGTGVFLTLHEQVEEYKRLIVESTIERANGNKAKAAKMLGIGRTTLQRIIGQVQ